MIPVSARNIEFVASCDQGGRGDGVQVMVHKGHAFVGHMFSDGFTIVDVGDPKQPAHRELRRGAAQFARLSPANARRPAADGELAEYLGAAELFRPERLFQGLDHRHLHPAREGVCRGAAGLRHLAPGRAARDRLHAGRGAGAASPLVCRWPLCLCLRALGGLYRPYPRDHRHDGADPARNRRALVAAGHACGRRRDSESGQRGGAMRCITRSSPAISPMALGATAG